MMQLEEIKKDKKRFLPLLLLGDEQESMIDRYLERGSLFVLYDRGAPRSVAVVTLEGNGVCELKNLATAPQSQHMGYGSALIRFLGERYATNCITMLLGTGESADILRFYAHCGFHYSHRIPNFFIENYDHPIFENGIRLRDMIYLKKQLQKL